MSLKVKDNQDKLVEYNRYNRSSKSRLNDSDELNRLSSFGAKVFPAYLQSPYLYYEKVIFESIQPSHRVLDICCGDGIHSITLAKTGANVIATDIAEHSVLLAKKRAERLGLKNITFMVADAEKLKFEPNSFDFITCVGSLSYLDLNILLNTVHRLLKPNGKFIVLDSYNHNPIYKLNRYLHYLRGHRTISTLKRMPNQFTLQLIKNKFSQVEVEYFGVFTFLGGILSKVWNQEEAKKIIDSLDDKLQSFKKYSFKIVFIAQKKEQ